MNPKILLAALFGGILAGGASYFLILPKAAALPVSAYSKRSPRLAHPSSETMPVSAPLVITSAAPPELAEIPAEKPKPSPFKNDPVPPPPPSPVAPEEPKPVAVVAATPPPPPGLNTATVAEGTVVQVRLGETLAASHNLPGDTFHATLDQPLVAGGFVIAETGARVEGTILESDRFSLSVQLNNVNTTDGQRLPLKTAAYSRDLKLPANSRLSFTVQAPVTITERVIQ